MGNVLRILAIPSKGAIANYRCFWPLHEAHRQGLLNVTIGDLSEARWANLLRYDLVLWNRQHLSIDLEDVILWMRHRSDAISVWDTDDLESAIPHENPVRGLFWERGVLNDTYRRMIANWRACNAMTVSTEPLRDRLRWFNEEVFTLANEIEPASWQNVQPFAFGPPLLVFAGSHTHRASLAPIVPAIEAALRAYPRWRFALVGYSEALTLFSPSLYHRILNIPFGLSGEYQRWLAAADLVIRPLSAGVFNACKSENPILESGAVGYVGRRGYGVPILTSELVYGEVMREAGVPEFVVTEETPEAWEEALLLAMRPDRQPARREAGSALFDYVQNHRTYEQHAREWVEVYERLVNAPRRAK